ncbi:uncharacterized protein [Oryza sativa Japonica Group]|uniref:uncharacterized protein n=1 Tax=Oryza sativa subsp. japonica TaxID=39947 RepID=UPI00339C9CF4
MVLSILGNGRAKSGHQPLPPAVVPAAVPAPPVAGSLPHHIKCNPLRAFSRFSPFPSSPTAAAPLPAVLLSLPCRRPPPAASPASPERRPVASSPPTASPPPPPRRPALRFARRPPELRSRRRPPLSLAPATSSRLPLLARTPPGRAVFSLGLAAAPSPSVSPPFRGEITGDAPSPASSGVATTSPPPAASATSPERRPTSPPPSSAPRRRSHPRHHLRLARTSPEHRRPRRFLLPPRRHLLRLPRSPRQSVGRRRRLLPRRRRIALHPGLPSVSPERRREPLRPPHRSCSAARPSSPCIGRPPPPPSSASQRQGRPRHRFPSIQTPPRSIIVVSDRSRRRRPVHPRSARRLAAPPPSSSSLRRVPRRPRLCAATAGCPRRPLAGPGRRRRRRPLVVPGRRGVRPSVKPFPFVVLASSRSLQPPSSSSSSPPRRQASCRPRLAFVQGSPPKPSPRRSSPLCPSVSAAPVRRCRSRASSRGGL